MANELTAILFALDREASPFRKLSGCVRRVDGPVPAWWNERGTLVAVTGMGAERSRAALDWLLHAHRPARVISAGFCGSLVEAVRVGTLVRPIAIFEEDDPPEDRPGPSLVSVRAAVLGTEARRHLHATTGAAVVDMESATVMRGCAREGIAFDCLRVVSDDLSEPLPAELASLLDGERLLFGRLLVSLARRPALVVDLMRLARRSRDAARLLAEGLLEMTSGANGDSVRSGPPPPCTRG